jgi:hypothetical protein
VTAAMVTRQINFPVFCNIILCLHETGVAEYSDWIAGSKDFSFLHCVCDLSGLIQPSYPTGIEVFFPGVKPAGSRS